MTARIRNGTFGYYQAMFTATEVVALTGLDSAALTELTERPGRWTVEDLFAFVVVADLLQLGMPVPCAGRVRDWLRMDHATTGPVFIDAEGFVLGGPDGARWIVDLDAIAERLRRRADLVAVA